GQPLDEQARGGGAELALREVDRGQPRRERVEPRVVVAGHDRDVFGATQLVLAERTHEPDAHQVVRDEYGVGTLFQKLEARAVARFHAEIAFDDQRGGDRRPPVTQRRAITIEAAARGRGPPETGDEADAAVAEPEQMRDAFMGGALVVHFDDVRAEAGNG